MKICPSCNKQHSYHTSQCPACYKRGYNARREPRQCSDCKRMKRNFATEILCSTCYQQVRNKRMVGICVDCGQRRRIPSSGRCGYCDQKQRRLAAPVEQCVQCSRMSPRYVKGFCRSCYTNNVKRAAKYRLRAENYSEMIRVQGNKCAICLDPFWQPSKDQKRVMIPHVDHDHDTGHVRALLCYKCNVGLGSFRDSPMLLRLAAAYLESDLKSRSRLRIVS